MGTAWGGLDILRITVQSDLRAAKSYFHASHDYLVEDGRAAPGVWSGLGAERLDLRGDIRKEQWDLLCENRNPDSGEQLTAAHRANRRLFYDCTWSAPKTVSVASLTDPRITDLFRASVAYANALIEQDLAVRVRADGADEDRVVGNAVIGSYLHRTSRPVDGVADVQLHVHSCFFNAAWDAESGRWLAAQLGPVKTHAGFYEQAMLSHLARGLQSLRYGVRRKGRYFEIEHLPDALADKFSRRRDKINRTAAELGITDPDRKAELAATTREAKSRSLSEAQLAALWMGRLTADEKALLHHRPGQVGPRPGVAESIRHAFGHVFETEAVVPEKKVYEHALMYGVGGVTLEELRAAVPAAGLLARDGRATTRELLRMEREVIDFARFGRGTCRPLHPHYVTPPGVTLGDGQAAALRKAVASPDRLMIIRGAAGTGKTTALEQVARAVREANVPLVAAAVTHTAKDELVQGVDPHAVTVAGFLTDPKARERARGGLLIVDEASTLGVRDLHALTRTAERLDTRLLLVGDDRQHGSVAAGSPFALLQSRAGIAPAEITEIRRQKPPRYKEVVAHLSEERVAEGLSLLEQMGWLRERPREERLRAIADDYLAAVRAGKSVAVVSPTNADCEDVTGSIRQHLREHGRIGREEKRFPRLVPLHLSVAQRADPHSIPEGTIARFVRAMGGYESGQRADAATVATPRLASAWAAYREETIGLSVGDAIRTTAGVRDASGRRVANNTRFVVSGFAAGGVRVRSATGVERVLPDAAVATVAHAVATTSFSAQGATFDTVIVSEPSSTFGAAGRQQLYVAVSRARHACVVYTDDIGALRDATSRDRTKGNAHDLVAPPAPRPAPAVARVRFLERVRQVAAAVGERVRHLVHRREAGYEYG